MLVVRCEVLVLFCRQHRRGFPKPDHLVERVHSIDRVTGWAGSV